MKYDYTSTNYHYLTCTLKKVWVLFELGREKVKTSLFPSAMLLNSWIYQLNGVDIHVVYGMRGIGRINVLKLAIKGFRERTRTGNHDGNVSETIKLIEEDKRSM